MKHILAIDQGTTSSRAILFDENLKPVASAQEEFTQHFPASGWVEHDASDLWATVAATARAAIEKLGQGAHDIAAIGITNQRETVVLWDRATGRALHRAIVWQDRRTADLCETLKEQGHEAMISARTGLLLDPYFSGTKLKWLLDNVDGARARRGRRAGLRHRRQLADLEPDRGPGPCHRRHQCRPHAAIQYRRKSLGRRYLRAAGHSHAAFARGARLRR